MTGLETLTNPASSNTEFLRNMFLTKPDQMAMLKANNPRLADALTSGRNGKTFLYFMRKFFFNVAYPRFSCNSF